MFCLLMVYVLWAVREGNKKRQILPVRTYKIGPIQRNPGNRLVHSPRKIFFESPPRKLQCSNRAQNLDHRFRTAFLCRRSVKVLAKSARTKRQVRKQTKTSQISYYIARNVFYCLLVKANNTKCSCQLLLLFRGRFERSGVQASCRAPNSIYKTR